MDDFYKENFHNPTYKEDFEKISKMSISNMDRRKPVYLTAFGLGASVFLYTYGLGPAGEALRMNLI